MKNWFQAAAEGLRFYFCIIPRYWWAWPPCLPLPPKLFIKFRLDTAYGAIEYGDDPYGGRPRPPLWKIVLDTKRFLLWRRKERLRQQAQTYQAAPRRADAKTRWDHVAEEVRKNGE
jgi:hypothetical protein